MELTFLQSIILYILQKLKGERTIYAIFHLLHGKKSSQTIQDAHLFHLTAFFQTDVNISRQYLEKTITDFMTHHMIIETSAQHYIVTEYGESQLSKSLAVRPIPIHLNGWKYQRMAAVLWERMSLCVQVISHLQNRESKYIPVQRRPETLVWIRQFLKRNKLSRESLGLKLYNELVTCLESDSLIDPSLLVMRLSGYRSVGLTATQAAKKSEMELSLYHYHFLNILHYLVEQIEINSSRFPILASFLDQTQKDHLTISTEKTFALLKQGYSVTDIMTIRRLKKSTIEDHLVELALNVKEFSIDHYVSMEKQQKIKSTAKTLNTKQLKQIRNATQDADYFEIRLVLAKYGEGL
ncbi:helix-turn-helix domain-containing protein [Bacillus sp. V3B]|uniref:helix-turn-helix domain-containing protein n=1 Tax=Bacillus sp. V3B TaxID=2804915 RepID=UPI002109B8E9|nr:helix-turn-helix domain-containing protein [Bacillus sp. V3B]MCQ6273842.1 helix-turn-helix domain-containing protein [Bacillus sp. V3B]